MLLSPASARRIVNAAITQKVLIITVTEKEQREFKDALTRCIKNSRLREMLDRRNYHYHIHINGMESICVMDYETWISQSKQMFYGAVYVTSIHIPSLPHISGDPIVLR